MTVTRSRSAATLFAHKCLRPPTSGRRTARHALCAVTCGRSNMPCVVAASALTRGLSWGGRGLRSAKDKDSFPSLPLAHRVTRIPRQQQRAKRAQDQGRTDSPPSTLSTPEAKVGEGEANTAALTRGGAPRSHGEFGVDDESGVLVESPPQAWHSRELVNQGRVFSETFPIRYDEVGPDKQTTMRTVASMIQERALALQPSSLTPLHL